jgi:hypothetical protein
MPRSLKTIFWRRGIVIYLPNGPSGLNCRGRSARLLKFGLPLDPRVSRKDAARLCKFGIEKDVERSDLAVANNDDIQSGVVWGQQRHVLQVEGKVRRPRCIGREAFEVVGGRECQAEEAVGRGDARQRHAEGYRCKKCMVCPGVARSFVLPSEAACVNVSGLSRVSCCYSQAMMRCARIVPKKWYEQKELDFLTGLTMRRSTVPTSVLEPRN